MAEARRIVILDGNGVIVKTLDISEIDNANAMFPMLFAVETRCDLGQWHRTQADKLLPWGNRIKP